MLGGGARRAAVAGAGAEAALASPRAPAPTSVRAAIVSRFGGGDIDEPDFSPRRVGLARVTPRRSPSATGLPIHPRVRTATPMFQPTVRVARSLQDLRPVSRRLRRLDWNDSRVAMGPGGLIAGRLVKAAGVGC